MRVCNYMEVYSCIYFLCSADFFQRYSLLGNFRCECVSIEITQICNVIFINSGGFQLQPTATDVGTVTEKVTSSEEIPAETLQCPLPEPSRAYPFCQENVVVRYFFQF